MMRKILKKSIWALAIFVSLFWMTLAVFFVSSDIQILEPEEQQKIKAGKHFWEWRSPYGPLAMHYVEKGEGNNHIILLHGFRAHSYTWNALINPLAEAGYHVWTLDLIGYGLSDKPDHAVYNDEFFVQQIKAFMDANGIANAHLVGNSMGGGLALSLAISDPAKVNSLTLLNALGYSLDLPFYISVGKHFGPLWAPFLGPALIRFGLEQIVYHPDRISDEQVEAYSLPYRLPGGAMASILTLQKFDNARLVEMGREYASLQQPVLVIWGDHDNLIPLSHYEKFLKDFPNADTLLVADCGHIPQEEAPDQVLAAMFKFLSKSNH